VSDGSPDVVTLKPDATHQAVGTVVAALALVRRGLSMLQAKRAMEKMIEGGEVTLRVPRVESRAELARELGRAGVVTLAVGADDVDVKELRESLRLTQEQFALRYGLELDAVRNWEHGRRVPDRAARSYLRAIQRMPEETKAALEDVVDVRRSSRKPGIEPSGFRPQ
jgi:DNA-binding transcriptional regulator YiaG